jgi:hypothetical protein
MGLLESNAMSAFSLLKSMVGSGEVRLYSSEDHMVFGVHPGDEYSLVFCSSPRASSHNPSGVLIPIDISSDRNHVMRVKTMTGSEGKKGCNKKREGCWFY